MYIINLFYYVSCLVFCNLRGKPRFLAVLLLLTAMIAGGGGLNRTPVRFEFARAALQPAAMAAMAGQPAPPRPAGRPGVQCPISVSGAESADAAAPGVVWPSATLGPGRARAGAQGRLRLGAATTEAAPAPHRPGHARRQANDFDGSFSCSFGMRIGPAACGPAPPTSATGTALMGSG